MAKRIGILSLAVGLVIVLLGSAGQAREQREDLFPAEVLDKPLGIERLPDGNTLITDGGGAYYTATDAAILEVSPAGEIVWQYVGNMAFPHSAERLPDGETLVSDTRHDRVFRVDALGEIVWSSDDWGGDSATLSDGSHLRYPNDAELLENGHLLITDRNNDRVIEVDETGRIVWSFDQLTRPHNGDRLANGNTLITNSEENLIVEVNPAGEIVWSYGGEGELDWPRDADRLDSGNTLITDSRHNRIVEVDADGQELWAFTAVALPYEADRLPNGNTLIADNSHRRVIEVNPAGETVWSFRNFPETLPATLQNGGFEEDADGDGLPDGWYPADLNAEGEAQFLWDATVVKEGKHSAGGQYRGEGRMSWLQVVAVQPNGEYQFSGYLKAQILTGVVAYQLWFVNDLGGPLGDPITVAPQQNSTDWVKGEIEVHAPADAAAVQIWGQIIADGRAWFDDVRWQEKGSGLGLGWMAGLIALLAIGGAGLALLLRRGKQV
jgi:outer membrane protein assembly factor BamB